jgi:hypothetical protein
MNVGVVIAHYNEDLSWVNNLKYPYEIISRNGIEQETPPNKGLEASSYLEYIIKHYNNLPEYCIFLHGHRSAWHHVENIDEKLEKLCLDKDYCNINDYPPNQLNTFEQATNMFIKEIPALNSILSIEIDINKLIYKSCSQFYVKKECIQRHSAVTYIKLYDYLMASKLPSFWSGRVFEYIWHIIFTGQLAYTELLPSI